MLSREKLAKIVDAGISMMAERDRDRLLDTLVGQAMDIARCDTAMLYLIEDEQLRLVKLRSRSLRLSKGENGEEIRIPPVSLSDRNVSAYAAMHRQTVSIPDVAESVAFDFPVQRKFDAITGYHTQTMLVTPLEDASGAVAGVLQLYNALDERGRVKPFGEDDAYAVRAIGSEAAVALNNMAYLEELKSQLYSFVAAFVATVDERTPYNGSHTRQVALYAGLMADQCNKMHDAGACDDYFDENRREQLILSALLHDIGKMVVPLSVMNKSTRLGRRLAGLERRYELLLAYAEVDALRGRMTEAEREALNIEVRDALSFVREVNQADIVTDGQLEKVRRIAERRYVHDGAEIPFLTEEERECLLVKRGTLTEAERALMQSHVTMTEKILSQVRFGRSYANVPRFAAAHHELLDGTGYPRGLKGGELDLESRILTVADIYDALIATDRPYKKPMPREKAFEILEEMAADGKLEPRIVCWLEDAIAGSGGH